MRFAAATVAFLASAGFAAAATSAASTPQTTSSSGSCDAQNIVNACKTSIQGQIDSCKDNDWVCLCDQYTNLLTCYNNCPNSPDRSPVQNQVTQYCNAAAPLKSASSASVASVAATAGSTLAASATSAGASKASAATASATGLKSGATNAAGVLSIPAGGAFAFALGVAGML